MDKGGDLLRLLQDLMFLSVQPLEKHFFLSTHAFGFFLFRDMYNSESLAFGKSYFLFQPIYPDMSRRLEQKKSLFQANPCDSMVQVMTFMAEGTSPLDVIHVSFKAGGTGKVFCLHTKHVLQ